MELMVQRDCECCVPPQTGTQQASTPSDNSTRPSVHWSNHTCEVLPSSYSLFCLQMCYALGPILPLFIVSQTWSKTIGWNQETHFLSDILCNCLLSSRLWMWWRWGLPPVTSRMGAMRWITWRGPSISLLRPEVCLRSPRSRPLRPDEELLGNPIIQLVTGWVLPSLVNKNSLAPNQMFYGHDYLDEQLVWFQA